MDTCFYTTGDGAKTRHGTLLKVSQQHALTHKLLLLCRSLYYFLHDIKRLVVTLRRKWLGEKKMFVTRTQKGVALEGSTTYPE